MGDEASDKRESRVPEEGAGWAWSRSEQGRSEDRDWWSRNLPPAERSPQRGGPSGREARAGAQRVLFRSWYASDPFWRCQRLLIVLLVGLSLAAAVYAALHPKQVLEWLTGPEDPPLRLVRPDRLAQQRPDGTWVSVPEGADIQPGTFLRSGNGRAGVLRVRGGGSIRLDRNSSLKVQRLLRREDGSFKIRSILYGGRVFVRELATDTLPVDTVFTRIQPLRATYEVSHREAADGNAYSRILVFGGKVQVGLARGDSQLLTLGPGQMIQVAPNRLGAVRALPQCDAWQAWNLSWADTAVVPAYVEPRAAPVSDQAPPG